MSELFRFSWHNITVSITEKLQSFWKTHALQKIVLNDVSGEAYSKSVIAILGPSGCGKTTFLGALSGRIKHKSGVLKINNQIIDENIKNISGYIHQNAIFIDMLTVSEHLYFHSALLLQHESSLQRQNKIQKTLEDFGLDSLKQTSINRLSGGEKRKLSLAGVLLEDISILFCDEPTTGLDSSTAVSVVKILQKVASAGKIVLITIHQPSSELFNLFNNIILLGNNQLIFEGSVQDAKGFFESSNLFCPISFNPADFYIKCVTILPGEDGSQIDAMVKKFKKMKHYNEYYSSISSPQMHKRNSKKFFYESKWLIWRTVIDIKRNLFHYMIGYFCLMFSSLFLAISYAPLELNDKSSVQNIQGILLYIISEILFTNMYFVINIFPSEFPLFLREESLYSSSSYFLSKFISLVPLCLFSSCSVLLILFSVDRFLQGFKMFLSMTYLLFCANMSAVAIGLSFSATSSSVEFVEMLLTPIELILMIMSGIWLKINQLPYYLSWIKYLSPFFYAYESITTIFWKSVNFVGNCKNNTTICYNSGEEVLKHYGFLTNYDIISYNVFYLHLLTMFYCSIGFLGILRKRMVNNSS